LKAVVCLFVLRKLFANRKETNEDLYKRISEFYDKATGLWVSVWGEHLHTGHYGYKGQTIKNNAEAQTNMIVEFMKFGNLTPGDQNISSILDLGCGVGGSSLYLARMFQKAKIVGVTLSLDQVRRATAYAIQANVSDRVTFQIDNAMALKAKDGTFDVVWSLESGEHMPDKFKFISEAKRVLKPGGLLLVATWCHRETQNASPLGSSERFFFGNDKS